MSRRLERSGTNRVMAGVCGGIAEYLAVDATLVRAFFVISALLTAGLFILLYVVLLVLMPLPGERAPIDDIWPGARTTDTSGTPAAAGETPRSPVINGADADRRRNVIGYVLVALGFVFLLGNLGMFRLVQWQFIWPGVLIALGVLLLVQRTRP
jgi:phage shock protein PspC (stress-responsive transcriptional regulator)